ncbi:hypothetical protein CEXT_80971 [Caerostris extrusa]|uniref:Uncharacterized protein n=1 Tax=Caerostris extrusa TaxID=172846 RepID=A0AAV4M3B9_CAEEX|nr:hypothetical protein CEXT_80971 [Caerostris extrusa]
MAGTVQNGNYRLTSSGHPSLPTSLPLGEEERGGGWREGMVRGGEKRGRRQKHPLEGKFYRKRNEAFAHKGWYSS